MKRQIFTIFFLALFAVSCNQNKATMTTFDPTFAHTVYIWFKEPNNIEHKQKFEASLKKFLESSKYAKTHFIGKPPKASRDVVDGSFTYSIILSFESAEAQQKYQEEPVHLVFVKECEALWKKVVVYDSKGI